MALNRRDAQRLVEGAGLRLVSLDLARAGHPHARVARQDGLEATFVLPGSPSDKRSLANLSSLLRRFARGVYNPILERH